MSEQYSNKSMLEVFIFETTQQLEQLEQAIITSEKSGGFSQDSINEIFRFMHTIKGSSAMMLFNNIGTLAHSIEDIFYYLREKNPEIVDFSTLSDLVLEGADFIKVEIEKIRNGDTSDGYPTLLITKINEFLVQLKKQNPCESEEENFLPEKDKEEYISQDKKIEDININRFKATVFFEDGCEMENIRAYNIIHNLLELVEEVYYIPEDIIENEESAQLIREHGFVMFIKTKQLDEEIHQLIIQNIFIKDFALTKLENDDEFQQFYQPDKTIVKNNRVKMPEISKKRNREKISKENVIISNHSMISVNVEKMDKLMDLVGEMVIAEVMVTQNPVVEDLNNEKFQKDARQLHKVINEIQGVVMAIRMVPLSTTFIKMNRITRDMCKKLNKEVSLVIIGEETEVDKNIIEQISDPLMHLIRNAIDHGIEENEERVRNGKERIGTVTLEAKNSGSDVLIIVKDDGKGLNKEKILKKARENGLLRKQESEMTDKEIYDLILLPGFSTNKEITEFSGRGVGMDVVIKNLESVGGSVSVESREGNGTSITMKIPLTLAIIEGMNISVGQSKYTIPITTIKESFKPKEKDLITDPDGNEMIMVRGQCFSILRLHEYYNVTTNIKDFQEGILIMVENDEETLCLFVDKLVGQQQVVVKALPDYIKRYKKIAGLGGCTLLGDGSISLILDIGGLILFKKNR